MTKQELIEMVGSEEQADYAMAIILKNIKRDFVSLCIRAEVKEIETKLQAFIDEGVLYKANGSLHVNWGHKDTSKCYDANALLYSRNRTMSLMAVR